MSLNTCLRQSVYSYALTLFSSFWQKKKKVTQPQKLPNECLCLILRHFKDDIPTLRSLIHVNNFFFHVTLPLLMDAWMCAPNKGRVQQEHHLAILVLTSILHYHRDRSIPSNKDSAWMLLREHNLQLVDPATSQLLLDFLQDRPQPTVDYSAYISLPFQWRNIDFIYFIRLIRIPGESKRNASDATLKGYSSIPHTMAQQRNWVYVQTVAEALNRLVTHYHPAHLQVLSVEIQAMPLYAPYAAQMAGLRRLELSRSEDFGKAHVDKTCLFIRTNQKTFPKKGQLHITLSGSWGPSDTTHWDRETRLGQMLRFDEPKICIYRANECPRVMDTGYNPKFYDLLDGISSACLEEFKDVNGAKTWANGKLAKQQVFLTQAQKLRLLQLRVDESDTLSWAVNNCSEDPSTSKGVKVCGLEQLRLVSSYGDHLFSAANDAASGFGSTLQKITFETLDDPISNSIPMCVKMGGWVLPQLTDLNIAIRGRAVLLLGALNQCFQLQTLSITTSTVDHLRLSEMGINEAKEHLTTLAPIWDLPQLTSLVLGGFPALQFNYDSLHTMVALEQLTLYADVDSHVWGLLPRLGSYVYQDEATTNINAQFNAKGHLIWTDTWTLPKLQKLTLRGPPCVVFSFEWLRSCPSLVTVDLEASDFRPQRLPLSWKSPSARFLPRPMESPCYDKRAMEVEADNDDDVAWDHQDTLPPDVQEQGALWHSKMENIHLSGLFVMSEEDLVLALAVYVPNLSHFRAPRQRYGRRKDGYRFVKSILDAEKVKKERFLCLKNEEGCSGSLKKLALVVADYTLTQSGIDRLGLVYAEPRSMSAAMQDAGVTVFSLHKQGLIATSE